MNKIARHLRIIAVIYFGSAVLIGVAIGIYKSF